ncbi:hypothetical protein [Emticicia sp. W12TSBA100-4]|uniref:hypothetical protein n=1 Tax=Emticicia sp. W12TSBA100-4 TaxID=3160965 RepID=UPI003305B601
MKKNDTPNIIENLIPDFTNTKIISLEKQSTLRWLVGSLGMLLPILLWLILYFGNNLQTPLDSISHYFYTRASSIFIIVVSLLAIFLLVYKGYEMIDFILSTIAGICALLLLYFPTDNITCKTVQECESILTKFPLENEKFRSIFHFTMAGMFLGSLALMSIFLFTKKEGDKDGFVIPELKGEKIIFVVCGILMLLSMLMIITNCFGVFTADEFNDKNLTFWFEVIALEAFGFSWFVKGDVFEKSK